MTTPPADIPAALTDALREELDPHEHLLWSGTPHPPRYAARAMPLVMILSPTWGLLLVMLAYASLQTVLDLKTTTPPPPGSLPMAWTSLIVFSLLFAACVSAPLIVWCVMLARARATVYAITSTRIMELRLTSKGLRRMKSLEPSHPLVIARRDIKRDRGDLVIDPASHDPRLGGLVLVGIHHPREADRLIRSAFNPPT